MRDLARNPGKCPDWESNRRLFSSQASTKPHQPGLFVKFLKKKNSLSVYVIVTKANEILFCPKNIPIPNIVKNKMHAILMLIVVQHRLKGSNERYIKYSILAIGFIIFSLQRLHQLVNHILANLLDGMVFVLWFFTKILIVP